MRAAAPGPAAACSQALTWRAAEEEVLREMDAITREAFGEGEVTVADFQNFVLDNEFLIEVLLALARL